MSPIIPKYSSRGHVQRQLILFGSGEESNELNRNKLLAELSEWGENENLQPLLKFKDEKKKSNNRNSALSHGYIVIVYLRKYLNIRPQRTVYWLFGENCN